MTYLVKNIILPILLSLVTFGAMAGERTMDEVKYIKAESQVSQRVVYVGETFRYSVKIVTDNPHLINVSIVKKNAQTSDVELLTGLSSDRQIHQLKNGMYEVEVANELYCANKSGTFEVGGNTFRLDYMIPTTIFDPFWGYVRSGTKISKEVKVKPVKVKCKNLPKEPSDYSGAIGECSIKCETPEVRMVAGGEVSVIYTLSCEGLLADVSIPQFRKFLPDAVRLKSVRPQESTYFQNGKLISRITFECRVSTTEKGEFIIPPIKFTYFSPKKGKYEICESEECKIFSGTSRYETPSSGHYVYVPHFDIPTTNLTD